MSHTAPLNMTSPRATLAQTLRHLIPPRLHPLVLLSYPVHPFPAASGVMQAERPRVGHGAVGYGGERWDGTGASGGGATGVQGVFSGASAAAAAAATATARTTGDPADWRAWLLGSGERLYGKGPNDVLFVLFWAVALTLAREAVMRAVFAPFARRWVGAQRGGAVGDWKKKGRGKAGKCDGVNGDARSNGNGHASVRKTREMERQERKMNKVVTRFAEQGWTATYYALAWTMGLYVITRNTSQPFSSAFLWDGYPHTPLPGLTKLYYLAQTGFWFHQLLIINIEAPRRDHYQMLMHHVVTTVLVIASYIMNWTRVGCLIMVLMDFVDILLPLAKMFGYLGLSRLTDATFVLFLISWLLTRHIGYNAVLWSVVYRLNKRLPYRWDPAQGYYLTERVVWAFAALLGAIQVMSCIWFYTAVKVAYKVVNGGSAEDTRSDDEDDGLEDDTSEATIEAHTTATKNCHHGITTDNSRVPNGVQGMPSSTDPDDTLRKRR